MVAYGSQLELDNADRVRLLNNMIIEKLSSQADSLGNPIQKI